MDEIAPRPASLKVGTSGRSGLRFAVVMTSGATSFDWMAGNTAGNRAPGKRPIRDRLGLNVPEGGSTVMAVVAGNVAATGAAAPPKRRRALPQEANILLVLIGIGAIIMVRLATWLWPDDEYVQQTLLLSVLILLGITVLLRALDDGEEGLRSDRWFR